MVTGSLKQALSGDQGADMLAPDDSNKNGVEKEAAGDLT